MKTITKLLSMLMALIIASCATTQLKETNPCVNKEEISYQPDQTMLEVDLKNCFVDTVLPQKITKLENGQYVGVLTTTTKAHYKRQLNTTCDFEGEQELKIFKEAKDKDFEIRGSIGAIVEGTLFLLQEEKEELSKEDSLQQSNTPKEVLAQYDYVAVYTTEERSEEYFKGELYSFNSILCYPKGYTKNCLSKRGTGKVLTIFTPSKAESKDVCLEEEIVKMERKVKDSIQYYQENVTLKGTYRELQRVKEVQQATTTTKGITITGPKENVREFTLKHWRIDYERTDEYEKSAVFEENWLRSTSFYDMQKQTLFIDEDANGKWEFAVINGKKMTPEEYKIMYRIQNN